MRMRRIAAGLLSFILLMGNSLTVYATQTDTVMQTVSGNETVSENNAIEVEQTVSGNGVESIVQTESNIPEEYSDMVKDAQDDLQSYLDEKDMFAIVYLTDSYEVKAEPAADAKTVVSVPSARTVQIMGMQVEWEYWEKWEEYIPTVWYETQFYEGEILYSGFIEEKHLAYSDELLLKWKETWYMLFSMSQSLYAEVNYSVSGNEYSNYADVSQFPTSYQGALKKLKAAHPNWIFVPMKVNRNWKDCVSEQLGDYSWIYYNQPAEYRGNKINSQWYYASREGIEYYMDPRNFLTESNIFQFEQNTYNPSYHTQDALQAFLNNTFMKGVVPDDSQKRTYAKVIFDSGKSRGLSPFNLAARVIQEQGKDGTSAMISGKYPGYEGYYNHYNISASGTTNEAVFKSGLSYAKSKGWNTRVKSLEGGAAFIGNGYILKGQDTLYLQKFDIEHGSSSLHQYMQNIMAPYTEGRSMKTMYTNAGSLNSAFVFKIPVYNNMPNEYNFSINTTSVTLQRGVTGKETYTLLVKCNGSDIIDGTVTFKSADEKVAKVSSSGVITAVGSGETTISISIKYGDLNETKEFTCKVKVLSPLQDISLNIEEAELFLADTPLEKAAYLDENGVTQYKYANKGELPSEVTLEVSYNPADTTDNRTVTWTVADENIVSIEVAEGQTKQAVIKAKNSGSTTVTAKVGKFTKTAVITVRIPMTEAKVNLEQKEITLHKGETIQFTTSYLPKNTTDRIEPIWRAEDESVAVVENGMILAKGAGTTKIHAAVGPFDGSQSELTVQVTVKEYTVTFMAADGSTTLLTVPGEYGKTLAGLAAPDEREIPWILEGTQESYFIGWYTEKDGTGNAVTKNTVLYEDMILYPYFKDASEAEFYVKPIGSVTYTGAYIKPEVSVYCGSTLLKKDVDYTLSYQNNKVVNDGSQPDKLPAVIVKGKGAYAQWETTEYFYITPKSISHVDITAHNLSVDYTGNVQKLRPAILDGNRTLVNNVDYTLEYTDTQEGAYKEAGTYIVKVTGKGNYTGTRYAYITITKRVMMEEVSISVPTSVKFNNGKTYASVEEIQACEPQVTVKYNANTLVKDTDYTLAFRNNKEIGTASVTITGKGAYIGSKTVSFKIVGTDMATTSVTGIGDKSYTGEAITQSGLVVTDKSKNTLREGLDYTISYKNNSNTGKASIVFSGINGYSGNLTKTFTIKPYDIAKNELTYEAESGTNGNVATETRKALEIELVSESVEYDKAGAKTDVTVTFKGNALTEGTDYKVSYRNNGKVADAQAVDKPTVVITGKGLFTGELTKNFEITSKNISKVSMSSNNVTFRNKTGFCFVEPVLKDVSGRLLEKGTDYNDLTYTYVADTLLYGQTETIKLAGSQVEENDIPVANDSVQPYIKVTAKGIGNYTGEISCTYQILKNKTLLEQIFPEKSENNTPSVNVNQNVEQTNSGESAKTPSIRVSNSTIQLSTSDDVVQTGVTLHVENAILLPEKTVVACQNETVADCFITMIEEQTLYIQLDKEKQEQVPNGNYEFKITPVVAVEGAEVTLAEQLVTVTVAKKMVENASAPDSTSTIVQIQQEEVRKEETASNIMESDDDFEEENKVPILLEKQPEETAQSDVDDKQDDAENNISTIAMVMVVGAVLIAVIGSVMGVLIYKKKKRSEYFFDEEDDFC